MTFDTLSRRSLLASAFAMALPLPVLAATDDDWILPPEYEPKPVRFRDPLEPGSIYVDPDLFALYWITAPNKALRYIVGVGRGDLYEPGEFRLGAKKEWPSWTPTKAMIARSPDQYGQYSDGMPGGPDNPLGARALYLFDDQRGDTFLRIHGTPEPWTIGTAVSNGCVRLVNDHIMALYDEVQLGAKIVLLPKQAA